jgi:alpha-mannosidase
LLEVSNPNVVVSSLKPARGDEVVLRVYEAAGQPATGVSVRLRARLLSAREANLLEDVGSQLKTEGNSVQFDLHPFEIKTMRLRLGSS